MIKPTLASKLTHLYVDREEIRYQRCLEFINEALERYYEPDEEKTYITLS